MLDRAFRLHAMNAGPLRPAALDEARLSQSRALPLKDVLRFFNG
jgi:hypothetical protein